MVGIASIYESIPLRTWRRQAKANLAAPTESFKGKTVLLVGATGCILSEAIKNLADLEVSCLVFGVRNTEKAELLSDALRREHGDSLCIAVLKVDLLSFASVKSFAAQISKLDRIDVVVMGSAIMNTETRMTSDGWEESECTTKCGFPSNAIFNKSNSSITAGTPFISTAVIAFTT